MIKKTALILAVVIISAFISQRAAFAKEGFSLGLDFRYDDINGDFDNKLNPGIGLTLKAGYGFTPAFSLIASLLGDSRHDTKGGTFFFGSNTYREMKFGGIALDLTYNFNTAALLQPYLLAGVGVYGIAGDKDNGYFGTGYNLGAGANWYTSKNVSIDLGVTQKIVNLDKIRSGGQNYSNASSLKNGNTLSVNAGVSYHF